MGLAIAVHSKRHGKNDIYFIFGMPNCLQILLQRLSSISVWRGTDAHCIVSGLKKMV
jgi:hypothetical protein